MANRMSKWLNQRQSDKQAVRLEDVTPLHPDQYPAKRLKAILDERRATLDEVSSHPTGMPDEL